MSMLGENYIQIDGRDFTPSGFDYAILADETINQSEAGTELVTATRLDKHTFNLMWSGITAELLDVIESFCVKESVILIYRDKEYVCRARGAAPKLANKAYKYKRSDGIWEVSITLTEI